MILAPEEYPDNALAAPQVTACPPVGMSPGWVRQLLQKLERKSNEK